MRTYVYVDGFNLYYRALEGTAFKWLNLKTLVASVLQPKNRIDAIKYFTARVSGGRDPDAPRRQHIYLSALKTIPEVDLHYGRFLAKKIK